MIWSWKLEQYRSEHDNDDSWYPSNPSNISLELNESSSYWRQPSQYHELCESWGIAKTVWTYPDPIWQSFAYHPDHFDSKWSGGYSNRGPILMGDQFIDLEDRDMRTNNRNWPISVYGGVGVWHDSHWFSWMIEWTLVHVISFTELICRREDIHFKNHK